MTTTQIRRNMRSLYLRHQIALLNGTAASAASAAAQRDYARTVLVNRCGYTGPMMINLYAEAQRQAGI